ncbi:unnamed protein product [Camellia sinensis]
MSCNGCRVLRKGCSENCILRPCLQWIDSPESQGHATVFVAKFFGRAGLMSFIGLSLTPSSSEAVVGRVLNFWSSPEKLRPGTPSMNSEESGTTTLHESGGFGDQTKLLNLFT